MKFLNTTVLRENTITFNPAINKEVDCDHVRIVGVEYLVPDVLGGRLDVYNPRIIQNPSDAPTDSVRVLRLQDKLTLDYYWIALNTGEDETTFATACDQCCTGSSDFTRPGIYPSPNLEEAGCLINNNYTYFGIAPANPFGANVILEGFSHDGGQPLPFTQTAGGYTTLANLVTALTTNASALGTWTLVGNKIQLVSTTTKSAYINPVNVAQTYCLNPPSSAFTGATLTTNNASNVGVAQPFASIAVSQANVEAVATELRKRLVGTITVADYSGTKKITYIGFQKPISIANTGASSSVAFTAGVCS